MKRPLDVAKIAAVLNPKVENDIYSNIEETTYTAQIKSSSRSRKSNRVCFLLSLSPHSLHEPDWYRLAYFLRRQLIINNTQ